MKIILYFAAFTALFGAQAFNFSIGPFQGSLFRMAIFVALLLFICYGVLGKRAVLVPAGKNSYSVKFMLIWFLYAVLSCIWAYDINNWFRNVYFLGVGAFTTVLFSSYLIKEKDIIPVFHILQWSIFLQSIIGWYEVITRNYIFIKLVGANYDYYVNGPDRVPIAMQGNPNDFATVMFSGVFIAGICALTSKRKAFKVIYIVFIINYICLILRSTSRANILALLVSFAFMLFASGRKGFFFLPLVASAALMFPQTVEFLQNILQFHFTSGSGSDEVRLSLIKNGFEFSKDTIGFGVGAGQIEYWMGHFATGCLGHITDMHNWWMEILTGYGVWIFAGYIVFYCRLFLNMYKSYQSKTNRKTRKVMPLLICCWMLGFVVASVSASSNITCEWLWVLWSLLIAYQGIPDEQTDQNMGLKPLKGRESFQ